MPGHLTQILPLPPWGRTGILICEMGMTVSASRHQGGRRLWGGPQLCHPNQASAVQATRCPPAAVERRDLHHDPLNGHCRVTNSSCWGSVPITAKRAVGRCRHVPSRTMEAQLCAASYLPLQFTSYCY